VAVAKDLPEDYRSGLGRSIAGDADCVDLFKLSTHHSPVFVSARRRGELRLIVLRAVNGMRVTIIEFGERSPEAQKVLDTVKWRRSYSRFQCA
jgi:hypothetical protein